jgi:UDP-glucose 4-epimerase
MEIAVFGAAGFVGRNVVEAFAETDHSVRACDVVSVDDLPANATGHQVDITDEERVTDVVEGADAVVHLAAHQLPESMDQPRLNAEINVMGSLNVLEAARDTGVEKVFFSSASSILGRVEGRVADEDVRPEPRSPYAVTKHAMEEYLDVYQRLYDLDYLVFRFFNVYGPHQHPDSGAFVPVVMSRLMQGDGVFVTGDGQQVRYIVYAPDIASFIREGLEGDVRNEVVNMGYGEQVPLIDAIRTIADVVDVDPDIERRPAREDEIGDFAADTSKCERLFGHTPSTDFRTGLERTHEWLAETIDE